MARLASPVVEGTRERVIVMVALVVCLAGVGGLMMPVLAAANGMVSFATIDIPYVGVSLLVFFALVTLLPVADLLRRRLRATAWLLVPGLLGALPALLLFVAMHQVVHLVHALWVAMPDKAVEMGTAPVVLAVADVALILLGALALQRRAALWRARHRRHAPAQEPAG